MNGEELTGQPQKSTKGAIAILLFVLLVPFRGWYLLRSLLSDRLKLCLGVFAGNSIQKHASTGEQTGDVKRALQSVPARHYFSAKDYFHSRTRPGIGGLISGPAFGAACFAVFSHHDCTNRSHRSHCQRQSTY